MLIKFAETIGLFVGMAVGRSKAALECKRMHAGFLFVGMAVGMAVGRSKAALECKRMHAGFCR